MAKWRRGYEITVEAEASLDDFNMEDIIEYIREQGYYVDKLTEHVERIRYPTASDYAAYVAEFCKLNALPLILEKQP